MAYKIPSTLNNLLTAQSDLTFLGRQVRDITGQKTLYNEYILNLSITLKNSVLLADLLLNQKSPIGYLENIALLTSATFDQYSRIALIGNNLSNSMNDIRAEINPKSSTVTEMIYDPDIDVSISLWDESTLERQERNENRLTVVNIYRLVGLIGMFEISARSNFTTITEITVRKETLETYYEALVENPSNPYVFAEEKNNLDVIKNQTLQVLENKSQNSFATTTEFLEREYSVKQITYDLYGEYVKNEAQLNFLSNVVKGLNRSLPAHALKGEIIIAELR